MTGSPLSVRLGREDRWRLAELVAMLGTTPSDVVRQILRAAVPCPSPRFAEDLEDVEDPSERDTLPPTDERDTLPPSVDPRQLDLYRYRIDDQWERIPLLASERDRRLHEDRGRR